MVSVVATPEEQLESMRKTPRMTVAEAMQHQWTGPVALADAIDGCGADQLTAETAPWLYRQGLMVKALEKLFRVPYADVYRMVKGVEPPKAVEKAHVQDLNGFKPVKQPKTEYRGHKTTPETIAKIREMKAAGKTYADIMKTLHVAIKTIYKALKVETDAVVETPPAPQITVQPAPSAEEPPILETPAPVVETVKVVTYRPNVPVERLEQYRKTMEEILVTLECDARNAIDDRDYSIISELVDQMKAVQASIDLMTAEIRRCES